VRYIGSRIPRKPSRKRYDTPVSWHVVAAGLMESLTPLQMDRAESLQQYVLFFMETGLGLSSAVLSLLTFVKRDWIEALFGIDPDHGNGIVEWLIVGEEPRTGRLRKLPPVHLAYV
jgi:hypothetical protein